MEIIYDNEKYITENCSFIANTPDYTRYLKGKYNGNLERCKGRFIDPLVNELSKRELNNHISSVKLVEAYWDKVEKYTYEDAFNISNDEFRAHVFSSINIREMIENLGATKLKVEGIELNNKTYNELTESFSYEDYHYIAELYAVDGDKIGIKDSSLHVVKVWCTSTNEEHWLWVDENNCDINSPLDAIASTCMVYEPMVGKIKHIIRQGDVFLFEMNEVVKVSANDNKVRLSKDMYFNLLKSQA